MTERERLIELLKNVPRNTRAFYDQFADYLLENGVIVLPVKVGDTVYVLHNTPERIELGLSDCIYETIVDSIHISGVVEYHMYYKKIAHPDCDFFSDKDIGKTVFLTKEAEQALHKINHAEKCAENDFCSYGIPKEVE